MIRIMPLQTTEQRYEDLAKAIIIQAADDYKRYRFVLDTIELRKYKSAEGKYLAIERAKRELKKVEVFFKTAWFYELSNLDGEFAFKALEETYLTDYYPVRMAEMMDETKVGRFRVYEQRKEAVNDLERLRSLESRGGAEK